MSKFSSDGGAELPIGTLAASAKIGHSAYVRHPAPICRSVLASEG